MNKYIVITNENIDIEEYNVVTKTLTISNSFDDVYYLTFDNYVIDKLNINITNSNVTIIETYKGNLDKANLSINIDEKSSLNRFSIIVDTSSDLLINKVINNNGKYVSMQLDLTNNSIDSNEDINLVSDGASVQVIDGIYALDKSSKKYQTNLNHYAKDCTSSAKIFAINNDNAHVSIYTDAYIKKGAIKTYTTQEGRIINLTDTCSGIVLPNLHIDENNVEASHSCSVGSINADHIYYLTSRGISLDNARNILIKGYFNPILKAVNDENIKNKLEEAIDMRIK